MTDHQAILALIWFCAKWYLIMMGLGAAVLMYNRWKYGDEEFE